MTTKTQFRKGTQPWLPQAKQRKPRVRRCQLCGIVLQPFDADDPEQDSWENGTHDGRHCQFCERMYVRKESTMQFLMWMHNGLPLAESLARGFVAYEAKYNQPANVILCPHEDVEAIGALAGPDIDVQGADNVLIGHMYMRHAEEEVA